MKSYIVTEKGMDLLTGLAAKELRRYLYVLGLELPLIVNKMPDSGNAIIAACKGSRLLESYGHVLDYTDLGEEGYILYGSGTGKDPVILTGNTEISVLYAAYYFLELLGIRFYLHGDTIPEEDCAVDIWNRKINIREIPIFKERGIHPFHDFPEGPDWWNKDDYYAILTQLPKMRANFFALHTYPENREAPKAMTAEPLVWIGKKEDCNEDGTVKYSYPVQHFKTNGNSWGYHPMKTKDYPCGMGNIFEKDCYGPDYMQGYEDEIYSHEIHEADVPAEKYNRMFNAYGKVLAETFSYAKKMAVKTCIGTEAPLTIPEAVRKRLGITEEPDKEMIQSLYEGIFERIKRTHSLDYYWMWTPEDWTWLGNTKEDTEKTIRDFSCALEAKEKVDAPFELAVCGWTLGPQEDRAAFDKYLPENMPFSCINRNVGFDPIEPKFQDLKKDRPSWAIPWLEDDPAMISPQLWVGRMRRDAFDAKRYGCDGLLGIHWRTSSIAPNIKALMEAAWEQPWDESVSEKICLEGYVGADSYTEEYPECKGVLNTARKGCSGYVLKLPPGNYTVCMVFQKCDAKLDIKIKNLILRDRMISEENNEICVPDIEVEQDTVLSIDFMVKEGCPAISAVTIEGATKNNQLAGNDFSRKINCGGTSWQDYEADLELYKKNGRCAPTGDFYRNFSVAEFGKGAGEKAADIFAEQDGNMPRPSRWEDGPGNIYCNEIPWDDMKKQYDFVDEFEKLGTLIHSAGEKSRYDYWNHTFQAMKRTAEIGCLWGSFEIHCKADSHESALADYKELLRAVEELEYHLLMAVESNGDMGVITNIQQRAVTPILRQCKDKLTKWYSDLPELKGNVVDKALRLVVPTARTSLQRGEDLRLKVIVIGGSEISPVLDIRYIGCSEYRRYKFAKCERWVYSLTVPAAELAEDFEYHISLEENGRRLVYPCSSKHQDETVVIAD